MTTLAETSLPVDHQTVARALAWLDACGKAAHWPARTLFKLRLCLDETLTNITLYGYPEASHAGDTAAPAIHAEPTIRLRVHQLTDKRLVLEILDNGVAFDPTARHPRQLDPSLDDAVVGGHGLRLMRHYLENIRYERRDGWNRLELVAAHDPA